MDIAIHTNPNQPHQIEQAEHFRQGFIKHNLKSIVTASITQQADIHIVLGSNYAKHHWLNHDRVVLLDRCYFGDTRNHISIGWMNKKGGRNFTIGEGRKKLYIRDPIGDQSIFLADYNGVIEQADIIRLHPANKQYNTTLSEDLRQCNSAIGYNSTALVKAALQGLKITCKGEQNILNQKNWLELLPYANWNYNEILSGEVWAHLQ